VDEGESVAKWEGSAQSLALGDDAADPDVCGGSKRGDAGRGRAKLLANVHCRRRCEWPAWDWHDGDANAVCGIVGTDHPLVFEQCKQLTTFRNRSDLALLKLLAMLNAETGRKGG